jgi:hypothetical protein
MAKKPNGHHPPGNLAWQALASRDAGLDVPGA